MRSFRPPRDWVAGQSTLERTEAESAEWPSRINLGGASTKSTWERLLASVVDRLRAVAAVGQFLLALLRDGLDDVRRQDERQVREGLGEVADLALQLGLVLLGEQA